MIEPHPLELSTLRFADGPLLAAASRVIAFSPHPCVALVDGTRYRGPVVWEMEPITTCTGHEPKR